MCIVLCLPFLVSLSAGDPPSTGLSNLTHFQMSGTPRVLGSIPMRCHTRLGVAYLAGRLDWAHTLGNRLLGGCSFDLWLHFLLTRSILSQIGLLDCLRQIVLYDQERCQLEIRWSLAHRLL